MVHQKGISSIILLIGALALLLIGGGYYFYLITPKTPQPFVPKIVYTPSPTPEIDPVTGWKVYTNKVNGFSISYPDGWKIYFHSNDDIVIANYDFDHKGGDKIDNFSISIKRAVSTIPLKDSLKNINPIDLNASETVNISGEEAIKLKLKAKYYGNEQVNQVIYIPHGKYIYTISYLFQYQVDGEIIKRSSDNIKIAEKIISSFKFTEPSSAPTSTQLNPTNHVNPTNIPPSTPSVPYMAL